MQLIDLDVESIIIHQVFRRDAEGKKVTPHQSKEYTNFDESAMQTFKTRVTDALGDGSKAVQMEITSQSRDDDLPKIIDMMKDADLNQFAVSSYDIAHKLADAQHIKSIPGGIVVVFRGRYGVHRNRYIGIIKAEIHSGYEKEVNGSTNKISLKFVEELLLTPGSRLYKTAGFFEKNAYDKSSADLNDKWYVGISDYQISKAEGKAAARYFYSDFLGCDYPQTSARTTKDFYENTKRFIDSLGVTEIEKCHLINALSTYLRVDTSSSVSVSEFSSRYFNDIDIKDSYTARMRDVGLPTSAFTKDIEHIKGKLDVRKVNFRSNIKITAPSETFKDLITIEAIDGDLDEWGKPKEWTKVTIKDRIAKQE